MKNNTQKEEPPFSLLSLLTPLWDGKQIFCYLILLLTITGVTVRYQTQILRSMPMNQNTHQNFEKTAGNNEEKEKNERETSNTILTPKGKKTTTTKRKPVSQKTMPQGIKQSGHSPSLPAQKFKKVKEIYQNLGGISNAAVIGLVIQPKCAMIWDKNKGTQQQINYYNIGGELVGNKGNTWYKFLPINGVSRKLPVRAQSRELTKTKNTRFRQRIVTLKKCQNL